MDPEDFGQYERFYDFTEVNRKVAQRIEEKFGHLKSQDNDFVYAIEDKKAKEDKEVNEDDSWEDIDEGSAAEISENAPKNVDSSKRETYKLRKAKLLPTGELRLPSGRIAGHRDYLRIYK